MLKLPLLLESKSYYISNINRSGHITIREGDDIRKVAGSFCKTYSLNDATR